MFLNIIISFYLQGGIFLPDEKVSIYLSGYSYGKYVIRIYRVSNPYEFFKNSKNICYPFEEEILKGNLFKTLEEFFSESERGIRNYFRRNIKIKEREEIIEAFKIRRIKEKKGKFLPPLKQYEIVEEWTEDFGKGYIYKYVEMPKLEKGTYILEISNERKREFTMILITDIGFSYLNDGENVYVFVQNLLNSQPIKDADVCIKHGEKILKEGKTDEKGIFSFKNNLEKEIDLIVSYNQDIALSKSYIYKRFFPEERVYIYTDRPLYRPNHKVYFKIIARSLKEIGYKNYEGAVRIKIYNPRGNILFDKEAKTNEFGTYGDSLLLPENANLGTYRINVNIKENVFNQIFKVEEYRKPEFAVRVEANPKVLQEGEKVNIKVKGDYFFGTPVKDAKVKLKISRVPIYFNYYGFYEEGWRMEFIEEIEGKTNGNGEWSYEYEIKKIDGYYTYIFDANIEDESGIEQTGKGKIKVGKTKYFVSLKTDKYFYSPDEDIQINVCVNDLENKKLKEGKCNIKIFKGEKLLEEKEINIKEGYGFFKTKIKETGYIRIVAEFIDERGVKSESFSWINILKRGYAFEYKENILQIVSEKEDYEIGEKIKLIVLSPFEKGFLFYAVQSDKIEKVDLIKIEGNIGFIELDAKKSYSPNFFIHVFGNNGKEFYDRNKEIRVKFLEDKLNIVIESLKDKYAPGEKAKIKVKVTDSNKNPKEAEISVAVIDEALLALQGPFEENIFSFFYPKRGVQFYPISSNTFRFFGYFYEEASPIILETPLLAQGRFAVKGKEEMMIRKEFKDLALWVLRKKTDKNGEAEFEFTLPDNLTTWRIRVKACTENEFGEGEHKIVVTKDLLARLILPRFMRERDTVLIKAIVHNYKDKSENIDLKLDVKNCVLIGKNEIKIDNVPKGGSKTYDFKIYASYPGEAEFTLIAKGEESYDALTLKLPVLSHGMERILSISKILSGERSEFEFELPEDIENYYSGIYISPSYQNAVLSSLKELVGYPYGCVEQTMSKFLPDVAVKDIIQKAGIVDPFFEVELPKMIEKGLQRLYNFQHPDGGWGWWENDETHPFNTSYVLYGLGILKRTGYKVNEEVISKGIKRLKEFLNDKNISDYDRAFMLYTLSLYEKLKKEEIEKYFEKLESPYILSLISLILSENKREGETYFSILKEKAKFLDGTAYFEEVSLTSPHGTIYSDPVIITSNALLSSLFYIPKDEFCTKLSLYLLNKRKGASWHSTIATSSSIISLGEYMEKRGLFDFDLTCNIKINGRNFADYIVKKENINDYVLPKLIPSEFLKKGKNKIVLEKSGKGEILYSFFVKYYSEEENIQAGGIEFKVLKEISRLQPVKERGRIIYKKIPFYGNVKKGEYLFVKIKVINKEDMEYFMLEDPFPAGCEIEKDREKFYIEGERRYYGYHYEWDWDWIGEEVHDDRIAFFITKIYPGEHEFSYILRAYLPGRYHVMPAKASLMYFPDVFGHSEEYIVNITP
jgi:uncharacterized protein YfaS (alpha-2-macroglobulin family)